MMQNKRKLLITGGCGFIGSNPVRSCLRGGYLLVKKFGENVTRRRSFGELQGFQVGFLAIALPGGVRFSLVSLLCGLGTCS